MELQKSLPDYARHDIAVFAISYDPVDALAEFAQKYGITYHLLADEGSHVIRRLGLINERVQEHHAFYGIPPRDMVVGVPYPGAFILDEHGIVVDKRFQDSYRERETGGGLLAAGFGVEPSVHGPTVEVSGDGVVVRGHLDSDTYRSMQRLRLTLDLRIEQGYHVYGRPVPDGYVPLTVAVAPIEGLDVGEVEAPAPTPFRVAGLDEEFWVHESAVRLTVPLTFTQRVGDRVVDATVAYQLCSEADCLPPGAVRLQLPVRAISHVESDV